MVVKRNVCSILTFVIDYMEKIWKKLAKNLFIAYCRLGLLDLSLALPKIKPLINVSSKVCMILHNWLYFFSDSSKVYKKSKYILLAY